jgi:hypothetical protein
MSRSKGLRGPRRRRALVGIVVAVAVTVVALLAAAGAGAIATIPDNTYLFGPHQNADSTTFKHEGDCSDLAPGQVLWHFVLPQTVDENGGQLEAVFQLAGQIGPVDMTKHVGGVIHWDVVTNSDDVLLDAWTDATSDAPSQPPDTNRQIRLSHVCGGGGETQFDASLATYVHDAGHNDITGSSVALGTSIHDLGTVTPVTGTIASGTVHFSLYNGLDCGDTGTLKDNVDVALGTDNTPSPGEPSFSSLQATTTPRTLGAGDYSYLVSADLTSSTNQPLFVMADECEPFTVNQSQLSMDSLIHDASHTAQTSFPLGSVVHDTGKITGGVVSGFSTEPITFKFYAGDKCEGDGTSVNNIGADVGGDPTRDRSSDSAALGAGSYSYKAFVAGNDNYVGSDSGCEPFTVNKGDLTIRTDIHNALHQVITSADAGAIVHDTATLGSAVSGFNPTLANISFTFWTGNSGCNGTGTAVAQTTAEGTYVARTINSAPLAVGLYSYRASFSGDGNYNPAGPSGCEPLQIFNGALTIGYWANHLAKTGTSGCSGLPSGSGCSSNGPFTKDQLGKTICVSQSCPNGIIAGTLGGTTITTFQQAAVVFKNNNCSNASTSNANAAACLAAQLLGAELNIANGANPCACATIKSAIALLTAVGYNPANNTSNFTGSGYTRQNAIDLKTKLDNYNNAKGCPA